MRGRQSDPFLGGWASRLDSAAEVSSRSSRGQVGFLEDRCLSSRLRETRERTPPRPRRHRRRTRSRPGPGCRTAGARGPPARRRTTPLPPPRSPTDVALAVNAGRGRRSAGTRLRHGRLDFHGSPLGSAERVAGPDGRASKGGRARRTGPGRRPRWPSPRTGTGGRPRPRAWRAARRQLCVARGHQSAERPRPRPATAVRVRVGLQPVEFTEPVDDAPSRSESTATRTSRSAPIPRSRSCSHRPSARSGSTSNTRRTPEGPVGGLRQRRALNEISTASGASWSHRARRGEPVRQRTDRVPDDRDGLVRVRFERKQALGGPRRSIPARTDAHDVQRHARRHGSDA